MVSRFHRKGKWAPGAFGQRKHAPGATGIGRPEKNLGGEVQKKLAADHLDLLQRLIGLRRTIAWTKLKGRSPLKTYDLAEEAKKPFIAMPTGVLQLLQREISEVIRNRGAQLNSNEVETLHQINRQISFELETR